LDLQKQEHIIVGYYRYAELDANLLVMSFVCFISVDPVNKSFTGSMYEGGKSKSTFIKGTVNNIDCVQEMELFIGEERRIKFHMQDSWLTGSTVNRVDNKQRVLLYYCLVKPFPTPKNSCSFIPFSFFANPNSTPTDAE